MRETYCVAGLLVGLALGWTSCGYYIYSGIYRSNVESVGALPMLKEVKK